jgi:SAM-dependent methyltransferase
MTQSQTRTGTSQDVLQYYSRNWEAIANCYAMDAEGLPVDPAWYRRELYKEYLRRVKPASILDIGCGGGWTVLDALEAGVDARGIEPVPELRNFASDLLKKNDHDSARVTQDDLASLPNAQAKSLDGIALLSVLPHVPGKNWEGVHRDISRTLRPGGRLIAAYRNELFDLYTFNSFTIETFDRSLWSHPASAPVHTPEMLNALKGLMTNPDLPGPYFTAARDKSFGALERVKSNPLAMPAFLHEYGLEVERIRYYHFHCVPPLLSSQVSNFRKVNHEMEAKLNTDWRGNFMAAMFLVEAVRV